MKRLVEWLRTRLLHEAAVLSREEASQQISVRRTGTVDVKGPVKRG